MPVVFSPVQNPYQFDLSGGILCLDFANTVSRRKVPERSIDHLTNYDDLVAFAEQSKIVSPQRSEDLRAHAKRHGKAAAESLRKATARREDIYRAFSTLAEGRLAESSDIQQINHFALEALQHRSLSAADGRYHWEWNWSGKHALDSILWCVAQSAVDLLTSPLLAAVRLCEAPDCAWLFLDHSRNHSRRWCDMKVCGNREKARRHYRRAHP